MKVYIAGSTYEAERARIKAWHERLTRVGITVVSTWLETIEQVGATNPREASKADRITWSIEDLDQLRAADVVWFLVPPPEAATRGAWFEFGVAYQACVQTPRPPLEVSRIVTSGDTKQSIFCALVAEFEDDVDAFIEIVGARERGCMGQPPLPVGPPTPVAGIRLTPASASRPAWLSEAEENLAHISLELQARGFSDGLWWGAPDGRGIKSRIDATREDPTINVLVIPSPYAAEPYTFGVCQYDPTGVAAPIQHIPNHTVTMPRLFEELDALLKHLGIEPKPQT